MSQPSMSEALRGVVRRDLLLAMRHRSDVAMSVFFVVIVASLFPLGVGPEPAVLRMIASGVLWVTALLACLLSLGRLFTADYLDGVLEQTLLIPQPLAVLVVGKVFAHWVISGLPVVLLSPLLGLQFGLSGDSLVGVDVIALAWYADVEYDWSHRCCAYSWVAWERLAGCPPSASAFYSGADLWGRRRHE